VQLLNKIKSTRQQAVSYTQNTVHNKFAFCYQ